MISRFPALVLLLIAPLLSWAAGPLDIVLEGGTVYSGNGGAGLTADVGISEDRIVAIGDLGRQAADLRLDVSGMAVAGHG
jgi:N-acyl-D-aspartate/D-glutamate deacylase